MHRTLHFILATAFWLTTITLRADEVLPLAGQWRFALDRNDAGTNASWFNQTLPDKINLPGILEAQGYGDEISIHTPWVLSLYDHFWFQRSAYAAYTNAGSVKVPFLCQPPRHYVGPAWYQRDLAIPTDWNGKRVTLFLERPHWKSTVWLDDREIGSDISLCTPHEYDLGLLATGKHRLTIRVDNRMILPYRPDAHSVSDSLDDAWNGLVGKIELRATPPVWLDQVRIFPNLSNDTVLVTADIHNATGKPGTGSLTVVDHWPSNGVSSALSVPIHWETTGGTGQITFGLGQDTNLWDEFHPALVTKTLVLTLNQGGPGPTQDPGGPWQEAKEFTFGLRDFHTDGNQFILNGHPIYFRGTHFGGDFPLTGYPPTDVEPWKKIIRTCKNHGLNHLRFHSWCPPEAAFAAADELGFYLQVECGMWNEISPGSRMEAMLYDETERILRDFGNHPSLMLISAMNEAHGNWQPSLSKWVKHFRAEDPRHLYTPDTGWSLIDSPDQPLNGGADYLAVGRIGSKHVRGEHGWFGSDYGDAVAGVAVPVIGHEVGQWVAYPDFEVIKKFTGFMRPGNYEIFRDSAAAHGLLANNQNFARASGRFQLACYKEEIEANLRTPGMSGFQLLDLHDYTGQGTALVGLLDPFWDAKGYATTSEFTEFCQQTVPLARLTRRTFTTADAFSVPVEVAHFDDAPLEVTTADWEIANPANEVMARGRFAATHIPIGKNYPLGIITTDLSKLPAPAQYRLRVIIGGGSPVMNEWNFWLYPAKISDAVPAGILLTSSWDQAGKVLSAGGEVLFVPRNADLDWSSPPLARVPVFWNALMGPTWSRMLGLWCDTNSPALAEFPTEANCDWQWTELLHDTRAVNLDQLPRGLAPIVSAIDDWNRNYKLGFIFEARAGAGKLLVCSVDLSEAANPGSRQLRRSLLDYMAGDKFRPQTEISLADFTNLHFDTRLMHRLGATATADGHRANELIDGDPNTFWSSADSRGNGPKPPHEIIISFPQPVAMNGLVLMPRQNQREHQGDMREFKLDLSDDRTNWQEVASGQLASTFDQQKISFAKTTAQYIKFTSPTGFGADRSAALAELAVVYAGPELPEDGSSMEYKSIRTASPDIDAGDTSPKPAKRSP
jgi:hypothetical protein